MPVRVRSGAPAKATHDDDMGTSHSIDLVELNALIEDRGVSTWMSWRVSPREPRVGYGFGDLPVRSVDTPPGTSTSMLGGTRRIVDDGQATIEGGGGFMKDYV